MEKIKTKEEVMAEVKKAYDCLGLVNMHHLCADAGIVECHDILAALLGKRTLEQLFDKRY